MKQENKIELSKQDERFCQEYIIDLNGAQSWIRAGHKVDEHTARTMASRKLTKVDIQERIQQLMDERAKRTELTADKVIAELARVAFNVMTDYAEWGPDGVNLKKHSELTQDQAAAVESVKESVQSGVSIKLYDKLKALELLGKHLSLFTDVKKVEHSGNLIIEIIERYGEKPEKGDSGGSEQKTASQERA